MRSKIIRRINMENKNKIKFNNKLFLVSGIALVFALVLVSGCVSEGTGAVTATGNNTGDAGNEASAASNAITIPLSSLSKEAKWFEYNVNGAKVRFFAVEASNGSIKTAFDSCDVCYYANKGYSQEGSYMVCNNCGNKYPIDGLGTENKKSGGCWPGYLPSKIEGNNLVIQEENLEAGVYRFE